MATNLSEGQKAPAFSGKDQNGNKVSLADFKGKKIALYFYPEDDTPLCTAQACQFRDHHPDFTKIKAVVLGISPDSVASHSAFVGKHALPFTLLADVRGRDGAPTTCTAFGAWAEKNMYGNKVVGMLRTTYVIDPKGRVARRWDRVKTPGHAAAVLGAVRSLHAGDNLVVGGKIAAKRAAPSRQKTRTQGGHPGYSGVLATKGKKTASRTVAAKAKVGRTRVRGKGA